LAPWSIDVLLAAGDLLDTLAKVPESSVGQWLSAQGSEIERMMTGLGDVLAGRDEVSVKSTTAPGLTAAVVEPQAQPDPIAVAASPNATSSAPGGAAQDRTLRIGTEALNRVLAFAGEALVQSKWFDPFGDSLLALKRLQHDISENLDAIETSLGPSARAAQGHLAEARGTLEALRNLTAEAHGSLETFALRSSGLSDRLYHEVVSTRMRPFGDGVEGFPRLVRDVARQLGKQAQIEITGRQTKVDREILDRLEAPLNHAIRNCLDHGLELPDERLAAGKPAAGTIRVDARHRAGLFVVAVSDDGRGVNLGRLRNKVVERGLATAEMAAKFSDEELIEFLFLPGFSTAAKVTDISGRGVGLDAVQDMAKSVGGSVRMTSRTGQGITLTLELPLTLSVLRTLVAEIGGEPFAFPLTKIAKTVVVPYAELVSLEGQHYFTLDGERIGVVPAHDLLGLPQRRPFGAELSVVLLGQRHERYGLAVDGFRGEHDMVVRPLDLRLGKVQDVSASAVMEDGSPILILDVDDLVRSIATELQGGRLRGIARGAIAAMQRRRILVVEDSITVREVERAMLKNRGYEVEVAVDGADGWNALRSGPYDLVITDIDMPRMSGLELVTLIRADSRLQSMPVIIVSYKDREEDRMKGLEVGADRYMTKSSFHDQTLLNTVMDLIGAPA
jgi:two-component system sensor histidine kinase and response regulator WspE